MQVDSEGKYVTKNPVCRDVVLGGGESITQIDDAVVFASNRGIMQLYGDTAKCLSGSLQETIYTGKTINVPEVISGSDNYSIIRDPFKQFLQGCMIGYDNIEQRLFVFNPNYSYVYVLSDRDNNWHTLEFIEWEQNISSVIHHYKANLISCLNSYPENLVVQKIVDTYPSGSGTATVTKYNTVDLYDIALNQLNEENRETTKSGWFLTRPISLGDPNQFKVIDVVRQNGQFSDNILYAWIYNGQTSQMGNFPQILFTKVAKPTIGYNLVDKNGDTLTAFFVSENYTGGALQVRERGTSNTHGYVRRYADDIYRDMSLESFASATRTYDTDSGAENVFEYAKVNNAYTSSAIKQILYGSNDLKNWFIISSSQSFRISDYSGSPYKWFRLAVKCTFRPGDSLSSVTFSWRSKFENNKLL